jgi:hypothetical protein
MDMYYITFRSVTFAQRGEKLLSRQNFRVSLLRTPRWMEEQGCGYALKLWSGDLPAAVQLLQDARIQLRRIYAQREDGHLEEVTL